MTRLALLVWLLLVQGCLYLVPASPPTPVRKLVSGLGMCSAVVVSPVKAYTAGHCLDPDMSLDGLPVTGKRAGPDLAVLTGQFRGPYARPGVLTRQFEGSWVGLEGYGCDKRGLTRQGLVVVYRAYEPVWGGLEIELGLESPICRGDSGGAVWLHGKLVGVMTAKVMSIPSLGFATPLDTSADLDEFLLGAGSQGQ